MDFFFIAALAAQHLCGTPQHCACVFATLELIYTIHTKWYRAVPESHTLLPRLELEASISSVHARFSSI